jgi:hypothetical protein
MSLQNGLEGLFFGAKGTGFGVKVPTNYLSAGEGRIGQPRRSRADAFDFLNCPGIQF